MKKDKAKAKVGGKWLTVEIVERNKLTAWVRLPDGAIIKRRWRHIKE